MIHDYIMGITLFVMVCAAGYFALELTYYKKLLDETRKSAELALTSFINRERELNLQVETAEADADRLEKIVRQYVKDIQETAVLLKDENPPSLEAERQALGIHETLVAIRKTKPSS